MQLKNVKVRCIKQSLPRFNGVVKTYSPLQQAAAKSLSDNSDFESIACNVESITVDGITYTTDFVCKKKDGSIVVYECVYQKHLIKPKTVKLLDESQKLWLGRGAVWGIIVDADTSKEGVQV